MTKRLLLGAAALATGFSPLLLPAPAMAQATQRYVEVYGNDPCPEGGPNEIIVCARKPETERYRIPERLRQNERVKAGDTATVRALDAGRSGAGAPNVGGCSSAGAGAAGWTGCWAEDMRRARAENAERAQGSSPEP